MNWHRLNIAELFDLLGTSQQGLTSSMAEEKLVETGPNELQEGKKKSIIAILLSQFKDVMILILLAAAIVSGIIGDLTDTIVIHWFFPGIPGRKSNAGLKENGSHAGQHNQGRQQNTDICCRISAW